MNIAGAAGTPAPDAEPAVRRAANRVYRDPIPPLTGASVRSLRSTTTATATAPT